MRRADGRGNISNNGASKTGTNEPILSRDRLRRPVNVSE